MNDYERLLTVLRTTAALKPEMKLSEALPAILEADRQVASAKPVTPEIRTLRDLADLAKATPSIAMHMDRAEPKKIHAIRELRRVVGEDLDVSVYKEFGGLKAAKGAIEIAWPARSGY